jgi:hypothetical protein
MSFFPRVFPRGGIGGGAAFVNPASDPLSLLWWDPTTLSPGAVSSWVDRVAGVAAAQATPANQPTASATAIGGAYPGVTSDGNDILSTAALAPVGGKSSITVVLAVVDTLAYTAQGIIVETSANGGSTNGAFFVGANIADVNRIEGACRGTVGATARFAAETLQTVGIFSIAIDVGTAGANAVPFIRKNGATQSLTTRVSASAAGTLDGTQAFHMFARAGGALSWPGSLGDVVIRDGISTGSDLDTLERWMGARYGLSW